MNNIHWYPGHMAKTRRLIEEKIKLIDIVIEIVDARIPYSSKNPMMNKLIHNKKKVILMSKVDLADPELTKKWSEFYQQNGYQVITSNLLDFKELNKILGQVNSELKDKREMDEKKGLKKRPIRILVVGIPNVGKSTFINKLAQKNSAKTGDKAGVTKALQWIKVADDFELLDSPGVLWPKLDDKKVALNLALTGAIKEEILPKEDICIEALKFMNEYYQKQFYERYMIDSMDNNDISSIVSVLEKIGRQRGCLIKGNEVDYDKVYDIILKEIKQNTIARMTFDREITI
ncbi:ribosome biogenesis GTPase A [Bacilli bacterium PM5-3]|nr:ribosome biogenesis GTPase A [Bacilli bacterium PM5-3]MDH6604091.1 ribosome biogenesis GTPase A [Bacilli bacterium PM5-9]